MRVCYLGFVVGSWDRTDMMSICISKHAEFCGRMTFEYALGGVGNFVC